MHIEVSGWVDFDEFIVDCGILSTVIFYEVVQ